MHIYDTLTPKVSAILPCFNNCSTIERCISSLLCQTLPLSEILVYDDCSQDGTREILDAVAMQNPQITVFEGSENKGAGFARRTLLKAARGDYFAFIDADDLWHSTKLEKQIIFMAQENADICACNYEVVESGGKVIGKRKLPRKVNRFRMHLQNEIPMSMAVVRADLAGSRDMPLIRRRQDYAYWLNIFAKNPSVKCANLGENLGTYYRMPGSLSSSWQTNLKANYYMFRGSVGLIPFVAAACVVANVLSRVVRK